MRVQPYIPNQRRPKRRPISGAFWSNIGSKLSFFIFIAFALIGLIYYGIFRTKFFDVRTIIVTPSDSAVSLEIQNTAQQWLSESSWGSERKSNIYLVSTEGLQQVLEDKYPQFDFQNMRRSSNHSISFEFQRKLPFAKYCNQKDPCVLVDDLGKSFAFASESMGPALMVVEDLRESSVSANMAIIVNKAQILTPQQIELFRTVRDSIQSIGLSLKSIRLPKETFLVDAIVKKSSCKSGDPCGDGTIVIFNSLEDIATQTQALKQALNDPLKNTDITTLGYIDVSVSGKIYYK